MNTAFWKYKAAINKMNLEHFWKSVIKIALSHHNFFPSVMNYWWPFWLVSLVFQYKTRHTVRTHPCSPMDYLPLELAKMNSLIQGSHTSRFFQGFFSPFSNFWKQCWQYLVNYMVTSQSKFCCLFTIMTGPSVSTKFQASARIFAFFLNFKDFSRPGIF